MDTYYALIGDVNKGPLSLSELHALGIGPTTLVWKPGFADWVPADSLPELRSFFVKPSAPQPVRPVAPVGSPLPPNLIAWVNRNPEAGYLMVAGWMVIGLLLWGMWYWFWRILQRQSDVSFRVFQSVNLLLSLLIYFGHSLIFFVFVKKPIYRVIVGLLFSFEVLYLVIRYFLEYRT